MTGLVVGAPQTFLYFQRIQEQIVNFVTKNSRITREKFLNYMMATDEIATDVGTVLYGEEAVSSGLMDAIGSLSDALIERLPAPMTDSTTHSDSDILAQEKRCDNGYCVKIFVRIYKDI